MNKLLSSNTTYIKRSKTENAGRGVFALKQIRKGEIIEICPIIEVPHNDTSNITGSLLVTYYFYFGKKKERIALALGFGSIYNHSDNPNAAYKIKSSEKTVIFTAIKDICINDEITFNYRGHKHKNKETPLWFE